MFGRIDHVGVAVEDIDAALPLYRDALRLELVHRETVEELGVDAALLDVGDGHVELIAPLGPETGVGKFLASRGPGLHHVAYAVDDLPQGLADLAGQGVHVIDDVPRPGLFGMQVAFVHPESVHGVLAELVSVG